MNDFTAMDAHLAFLRQQVEATETQLKTLKGQLQQADQQAQAARHLSQAYEGGFPEEWMDETMIALQQHGMTPAYPPVQNDGGLEALLPEVTVAQTSKWPLQAEEYKRYGRQMIMPEIGLHGQMRLKNARVLVVGLGGLGCPAAAYLAGAGVGTMGLIDGDTVEVSNLHRQIAHSTSRVGQHKVDSAYEYLNSYVATFACCSRAALSDNGLSLNPNVNYNRYRSHLSPEQAVSLFEQHDLVLDCTDHPTSRYLISDACVLAGKPLVSASALKTEGQLIVLNHPPRQPGDPSGGPCYRCVFPKPPPADSVLSCGEGGVLGPVVGVMGVLQALEAIKVLSAKPKGQDMGTDGMPEELERPTMLMFSAYSSPQFRSVRMRSRRSNCAACSSHSNITRQSLENGSLDYVAFCEATAPVAVLPAEHRVTARGFSRLPRDGSNMLIDVRDETQYAICALRGSINVPWTGSAEAWLKHAIEKGALEEDDRDRYIVCRLGNDSQMAAKAILDQSNMLFLGNVRDIQGGFSSWREEVDPSWPDY